MKFHTDNLRDFKFEYKITLAYSVFGFLWILFSDKLLELLVSDNSLLTVFQTFKGSFFIIVTACFLYLFVKRHMQNLRSAESKLIESASHYRALFNDNLSVILLINPDNGKIEDANQAACNYYGWSHSELCKKSIYDINTSAVEQIAKRIEAVVSETKNHYELQHRLANGEVRDVEVFSGPIRIGNRTMVYSHINDITEQKIVRMKRKLAEEEIRKLSRAIDQSPVSVLITDLQGNITYVNEAVYKFTGYTSAELIGKNPGFFVSGETNSETYNILWRTIISGKEWKGEIQNKKKNGQLFWESISISPIFNETGQMTHFLAIKEDITERKKLNSDLLEAKLKAESSDRLKTAFLNNISHEVRTPLNGILGFTQIAFEPDLQPEERKSFQKILDESSERLVKTITNYMDISLIVSGNISVKSKFVDISMILNSVFQKFLPKCKTKNLEFIKHIPAEMEISVLCDEDLVEKVLTHLLDNSIKFTKKGCISFGVDDFIGEFELFVRDTGSGIDANAQNRIFQIFTQEDIANTRGYEGSGLGLSIAKGLVELMGGKIRMESVTGKGSTFYLSFPVVKTKILESITYDKIESHNSSNGSPVILIAEDDESNSVFFRTLFGKSSMKYMLAYNGKEALEICKIHPEIALVLMDIKMPLMDGYEATRKIKEFRKDLPIIGVTAFAMTGDKERALAAGCIEYVSKPVKSDHLLSIVKKHLGML